MKLKNVICIAVPILALVVSGSSVIGRQVQTSASGLSAYPEFNTPTRIQIEQDTYNDATRYLRSGDRTGAMNLINRDPLVARLALLRMLRDPNSSTLASDFAALFPMSSDSELESPLLDRLKVLPSDQRTRFLEWIEKLSRVQFMIVHHIGRPEAIEDLKAAGDYFRGAGFVEGQALSLRMLARNDAYPPTNPQYALAEPLYREALALYTSAKNARGEALCWTGIFRLYSTPATRQVKKNALASALDSARSSGETIAELYVSLVGTSEQKVQAWPVLEKQIGLPWLKYQYLAGMVDADPKYSATFDSMLAQETDPVTSVKALWQMFDVLDGTDDERALRILDGALSTARGLPYDMAAFDDFAPPGAVVPEMLYRQGIGALNLYQPARAESSFLASLDAWKSAGKPGFSPGEGGVLNTLAGAYSEEGDFSKAIETANASIAISKGGYSFQPLALLADIHAQLGDLRLAEEEFRKASLERNAQINNSLVRLANVHIGMGFYSDALKDMDDIVPEIVRFPGRSPLNFGPRLRALTLAWLRIGDFQKAMEFARYAETQTPNGPPEVGLLGMVWIEMGRYPEAEKYFKDRLAKYASIKEPDVRSADAYKNLGKLYRRMKRYPEAVENLTKALNLYRAMSSRTDEMELLAELGQVSLQDDQREKARKFFNDALAIAGELRSPQGAWTAHAGLADVFKAEGNTNAAVEHLKQGVDEVEAVSARLNFELVKSSFVDSRISVYDDLMALLLEAKNPEKAFEYAQRRRAQAALDTARRQGEARALSSDSELLRKIKDVESQLIGKQSSLSAQLSKPVGGRNVAIATLRRDLDKARADYTDLLRQLAQEDPAEASRQGVGTPLSVEEVQRNILKRGDALIDYLVTSKDTFAFVITPKTFRFVKLPVDRKPLTNHILELRAPFTRLQSGEADLLHLDFKVELAHTLYLDLITPLEPEISSSKRLVVIPDDTLNDLPLDVLVRRLSTPNPATGSVRYSEYGDVDWLGRHQDVFYAVSVESLRPGIRPAATKSGTLLAFGNPTLTAGQIKSTGRTLRGDTVALSRPVLKSLPGSGVEVTKVGNWVGQKTPGTQILTGSRANEAAFVRYAPAAEYIHFAVHGLVNEEQPYYSALMLSPGDGSDGWLQTYEIMNPNLKLRARMVTLSGCETGLGRLYKGEGVLGLRRAFLQAGAESVVASLWSIDDFSADFMDIFYKNVGKGQPLPVALQQAKLAYMASTRTVNGVSISMSNPFFWAPFTLTTTSIQ